MIVRYAQWIVKYRWLVILLTILLLAAAGSGGRFLAFTNDYRVFFSKENTQLQAFEQLQETYTKADNIFVMLEPAGGDVFTPEVLAAVADLTDEAWQVPHSIRVDSLTNFQHMVAEGDDLIVADLVEYPDELTADQMPAIRDAAMSQATLVRKLVSTEGHVTGINITLEIPPALSEADRLLPKEERDAKDPAKALETAVHFARAMVASMEQKYPDIRYHTTGVAMLNQAFPEATIKDMSSTIPMAFLVIIVGILFLIRSPIAMTTTVLVVFGSIIAAMGTAGWLGIRLTPPSASAPTLILTLAVADCVHFLVTFYHNLRRGDDKHAAIIESLRINFMPIFLTSLTTAIGFLSMNSSDAPPFRHLGNITAIGVMAAFVLAVSFLPAMVAVLPARPGRGGRRESQLMDKLASFVIARRAPLFWSILAGIIALAIMMPRNQLSDVFVNYFDRTVPFRVATDHVTDNLSGLYIVEYSLDSGNEGGVSDPAFLARVEKFENYLMSQPEVQHVSAITETMRRLNYSMHGDDEQWRRLPDNRELSAQYLLLYEMSLPYGLDLNNQINFDKSRTRVTATMETLSTPDMLAFEDRVQAWQQDNIPGIAGEGTGATIMFTHISKRNIRSMLTGTAIALVLISFILMIALRSVKMGVLSLVPNLTPAISAFGLWALLVGQVGLAVSVVVAMTLGIVVDDTIHFLSKYLRARRERNMNTEDAIRYAFNTVGVALTITTIVLVGGFLVVAQSNFLVNAEMGLLTAITIALALFIDFLFLPTLLLKFDRSDTAEAPDKPEPESGKYAGLSPVRE